MRLKVLIIICFMITSLSLVGFTVSAQVVSEVGNVDLWGDDLTDTAFGTQKLSEIGLGKSDPRLIAVRIIQVVLGLLGIIAVVIIMYGGFIWMTAGGEMLKVDKAKQILRNGVVGLLIILSAFAIATFIISRLLYSTGAGNANVVGSGGGSIGLGALGNGIIKSVYPAPSQTDVPRNTSIVVSFREEIDPATICDSLVGDICAPNAKILPDSIQIFKAKEGSGPNNVVEVIAVSNDNKTFVFKPIDLLGSQTEPIDYTVILTGDITKANGDRAFRLGSFDWSFEISTIIDLTPPRVVSIFPGADDLADISGASTPAVQAQGALEVTAVPQIRKDNSVSYVKTNPNSVEIDVPKPRNNTCDGVVDISINNSSPMTANVSYGMSGYVDTSAVNVLGDEIMIACGLRIKFEENYQAGHSWQLTLQTNQNADFVLAEGERYTFVDRLPDVNKNEVEIDSNLSTLAHRLSIAMDTHPQLSAVIDPGDGQRILFTAINAGQAGNHVSLQSSNQTALIITPMLGGLDKETQTIVQDTPDKPKNAIVQVNFNEAMSPLVLSGTHAQLSDYIRVVNLADNKIIPGRFVLSNQYRTVEFIPDFKCGANACGEPVYCLPGNSNIRVDLVSAELTATCSADADCATYFPYNSCQSGVCYDQIADLNYPEGKISTGVFDTANNSLDGNSDGNAYGPVSFYNVNSDDINFGDSYQWSFWINDILDLSPPMILTTNISPLQAGIHIGEVIEVHFNKLMMSSSINTGALIITREGKEVVHKLVNLWAVNGKALGYWAVKQDIELSVPLDNEPDETIVKVRHSNFGSSMHYRVHFGSGLKDTYQNCYKPSGSVNCNATNLQPSCCNDNPLAGNTCP